LFTFPAALLTILVFFYLGLNSDIAVAIARTDFSWIAIVPYIVVIVLAVVGINVLYFNYRTLLAGIIGYLVHLL
jgi:Na+/H+ antiporter NhaC